MHFKNTLLAFSALLLLFMSSCSSQEDKITSAADSSLQAHHAVTNYTLHAYIPGNIQDVYQMDLTLFPDGSCEAIRSIVPFNSNHSYAGYYSRGASNDVQTGTDMIIEFDSDAWFIPFSGQSQPVRIAGGSGGSFGFSCGCNGEETSGNCTPQVVDILWGAIRKYGCNQSSCSGTCDISDNGIQVSTIGPGVMVAANSILAN